MDKIEIVQGWKCKRERRGREREGGREGERGGGGEGGRGREGGGGRGREEEGGGERRREGEEGRGKVGSIKLEIDTESQHHNGITIVLNTSRHTIDDIET